MNDSPEPGSATPSRVPCNDQLGPALEDAAYECISMLASVDTHNTNMRDHPDAWKALEAFSDKVRSAERERIKAALLRMDDGAAGRHNYYAHAAWVLFDRKA